MASMECLYSQFEKVISKGDSEELILIYKNSSYIDNDKKQVVDQVFREVLSKFLFSETKDAVIDVSRYSNIIEMAIQSSKLDICSPTLPVFLLSDIFDVLTLDQCEKLFTIVENQVAVWKQEMFFKACKNNILRLCNDLLRRLSRSQNTIFCGRILLFLAKLFPFSERSGLNIVSEFNLDNVTAYEEAGADDDDDGELKSLEGGSEDVNMTEVIVDYSLYKKFWSLQDYFRNPNQCYVRSPWKIFCSYASDVLSAFSSIKLDERQSENNAEEGNEQVFAKYLTNQRLLELQLCDSNFRRTVCLQFLMLFQYLEYPVKFKQENQKLSEEQTTWLKEAQNKVYEILRDTPPDGAQFVISVRKILEREYLWNQWKNDGCPEFKPYPVETEKVKETAGQPIRQRRHLGDQNHFLKKPSNSAIQPIRLNLHTERSTMGILDGVH
uniref:EOG090X0324 n=1 Tax=Lynceus sp. MCZ IZ 141354 TaxID=1930659 RepID=A0A9N6WST1_9CRUS|nr:EOG090X0324 [Lynceus sp. MCZ IZ 141354]